MIKILLKKQLFELTAGIRVGRNQENLRKSGTLFFIGLIFCYVLVLILGMFGFLAKSIALPLYSQGLDWLYFSVMGAAAVASGVFGTIFTATDSLFQAKDNEILLSLPIPYQYILLVRMLGIYLISLLIMGAAFFPAILVYLGVSHNYYVFLFGVLTLLLLGLLVLSIDCLLGWIISLVFSRVKHKSLISVIFTFICFAIYYVFYSNFELILPSFLSNGQAIGNSFRHIAYPLYILGQSGSGNISGLFLSSIMILLLLFPAWHLTKRSFFRFAVRQNKSVTSFQGFSSTTVIRSPRAALLYKEWKSFSKHSNYVLSCGMGLILSTAIGFSLLLKPKMADILFSEFQMLFPDINIKSAFILGNVAGLFLSLCDTAAASVSFEGEHLSILKSLPIRAKDILYAKADLQFFLCLPAGVFLLAVLCRTINAQWSEFLFVIIYLLLLTRFLSYMNVIWNLLFPNLTWTNELVPLKQSISVLLALFGNILTVVILLLLYFSLSPYLGQCATETGLLILTFIACFQSRLWIKRKGILIWTAL